MPTVALFHSVLGVRQGVLDAADRLRADGHDVRLVDLYDGRTFDAYEPAMSFAWEETGLPTLHARALDAVAELPDGFVTAGFSLGCIMAVHVATQRPVSAVRDVEAGGGTIEVFDYPGSGHLFTDPSLPAEYDPDATETFWSRALPFVLARG